MLAPPHHEEEERLRTLRAYDILDTEPEVAFDDIVALASQICQTPVSLISLVDGDRQWFKARVGFEPQQTELSQSVCAHAILEEPFLEISDMALDPRTRDNTLHTAAPFVNFYAGAQLVAPNGLPIGTLCVLDTEKRTLTEAQREALRILSRQVMTELELRKKIREERALRQEIDHRVSNSLQSINSLLRLSSRSVKEPGAGEILDRVQRQISAVASLHVELMGRDGSGLVSARAYLERVVAYLEQICPAHIHLEHEAADVELKAAMASALGMIASEFAANSIKYGYPDGRAGTIELRLEPAEAEAGHLVFRCRDDGIGNNKDPDTADRGRGNGTAGEAPAGTGLGTMLMASAASQLNGRMTYEVGPDGADLSVVFAPPPI